MSCCDCRMRAGGPLVCLFFGAAYCAKSQQLMPVHLPHMLQAAIVHTHRIYFRNFPHLQKLLELYGRVRAAGLKFKIIFCSQDRDQVPRESWLPSPPHPLCLHHLHPCTHSPTVQASFDRFYGMQPWAALPFTEACLVCTNESSLAVIPMCALPSLLAPHPRHDQGQVQRVLHANVRAIVEIYARDIIAKYAS